LAEDNWKPVTSDEAKRSARKRGAAQDRKRHNRIDERARKAKGRGKASGRPAAIKPT
jgi:hypothetical protein